MGRPTPVDTSTQQPLRLWNVKEEEVERVRDRKSESAMKLYFRNDCISKTRNVEISADMLIWKRAISMGTLLDKELQTTNEFWEEDGYPLPGMRLLTVCLMQSAQP